LTVGAEGVPPMVEVCLRSETISPAWAAMMSS
jgi:hypothetical protein